MPDDGEGGGAECVKVAIRCRPPSSKEVNNNEKCIVDMVEAYKPEMGAGQVTLNDPSGSDEPSKFAFDVVFGLAIEQSTVYEAVGQPALNKTFEGYNGTIFAYGQTGSGKSFSMAGVPGGDLRGITPRVNEELFERIKTETENSTRRFLVMCSYFEIYNEVIFDLLNPVADRSKLGGGLVIKEHPVMGIYVKDLTEIVSESAKKLEEMLESGMKNRAVSSTMMNSTSSRSHSIFTIKVHQKDEEDTSRNVFAKLNLVDLAGSERQKGTGATGQTLKEGANINKSLSALGNVINALVECANGKKVFIPYRNSKLTRVLQESLGGNSLCTMLATLSPAACNYEETMSTLRYANRAKAIKVSATKNEEASQISRLKAEVEELKKKLSGGGGGGTGPSSGLTQAEREQEQQAWAAKLADMEGMLSSNWESKAKVSEEHRRKMQRLADERAKAEQAVDEERSKRLRLLQEKNDLELSLRGFTDLILHLPRTSGQQPVISGDTSRQWLQSHRALRQQVEELKEQRTMVLVFKHAFDEDVRLWGEGAEAGASEVGLALTGLSRCVPKLEKVRKGGARLLSMESESLGAASELADSVRQAAVDIERLRQELANKEAQAAEDDAAEAATAAEGANKAGREAVEEVYRMLYIVQKQLQEKIDELANLAAIEMWQTCEIVLRYSRASTEEGDPEAQSMREHCEALEALIADPCLAGLPEGMPRKPVREYEVADVTDTPETTEALLGQLIRWEGLCGGKTKKSAQELLARPPPKFLLDLTLAIRAATGFPEDIGEEWPEAREARLALFQRLVAFVTGVLDVQVEFEPSDVLKGKNVGNTLRLLQLIAVAAARKQPRSARAEDKRGLTRPRELGAMLNVMGECIQCAKKQVEARRQAAVTVAADAGAEESLADKIRDLERQIQEEAQARLRQEELLADMERRLELRQAEVKKITAECELNAAPVDADKDQEDLARQVGALMKDAAAPLDMPEEDLARMLDSQLEEVRRELQEDDSGIGELQERFQELQRAVEDAQQRARAAEAEVQRERQRRETEQELAGQSPEEQKLILQAHEKKLQSRAEALEAQNAQLQLEMEERKTANLTLQQEKNALIAKNEEAHLQMQVVQEERDALREAMEQLFLEKAAVDEELQNREAGYVNLSERLNLQQDETCELQSLMEQKLSEVQALQNNGFHMAGVAA